MRLVTASELAAGGDAVARAPDGRVVFVSGAAPDEEVEVEIAHENPTFLRARVVSVIRPSVSRVDPPCRYFGRCGGCALQHVAAAEQTRSKQGSLLKTLAKIGRVDLRRVDVAGPWAGPSYGYRSRARFAIAPSGAVGFRSAGGKDVVDIEECRIAAPPIGRALAQLRALVASGERRHGKGVEEVEAIANDEQAVFEPSLVLDAADGGGPLLLQPNVFSQANREGNRAMSAELERLLEGAGVRELVELYSGSGNFTRVLAAYADRIRAFEAVEAAHNLALRARPPNAEPILAAAEDALARLIDEKAAVDAIVANPPRSGMSASVVEQIGRLAPRLLIYVSCDPATLARDVARLEPHDLWLERVRLFDLYLQTPHSEVIACLRKGVASPGNPP